MVKKGSPASPVSTAEMTVSIHNSVGSAKSDCILTDCCIKRDFDFLESVLWRTFIYNGSEIIVRV